MSRQDSSGPETGMTAIPSLPTHDQIACRAYQIYEQSGNQPGQCLANWLQAERELLCEAIGADKIPAAAHEQLSASDVDELIENAPPARRQLAYAGIGA